MGHITNTKAEPKDILRDSSRDTGLNDSKSGSNKDVSSSRDVNQQIRSSDKREYSQQRQEIKPSNSLSVSGGNLSVDPNRSRPVDPSRSRPVDPKLQTRRREEPTKPYPNKLESDIKKHLSAVVHDKNSLLQKPVSNSTSHRNKYLESSKSIPNQVIVKSEHQQQYNGASSNGGSSASGTAGGSNGGIYGLPMVDDELTPVKSQALVHPNHHHPQTPVQQNQVVVPVMPTRKPGLFSPDQTPPKKSRSKSPSNFGKKLAETNSLHQNNVEQQRQQQQLQQEHITNSKLNRRRTSSTNSEPELRPVMKKIDEMQGFENIMRDSSIGLKAHGKAPEVVAPVVTENLVTKDFKPPDFKLFNSNTNASIINGTETDPTIISSLLKETPTISTHLSRTSSTSSSISNTPGITIKVESEAKKKDSSHKEHKKNKKEKHKHKDKEKSREEKEKKKKHKEKDREKHKHKHSKQETGNDVPTQPIKLTIPRDKIQFPNDVPSSVKPELKLKIPRDKIKIENISEPPLNPPATNSGLKIKIPRDAYTNVNNKRDRDKTSTTNEEPPSKVYKSNYNRYGGDTKTVRNSYDKVRSYNKSNQPPPPPYNFVKSINFRYPPPPLHTQPPPPLPPPYFHPYQSNQLNTAPSNHYYFNYQQQVPMQMVPYSYYPPEYQMYQNMYHQYSAGASMLPMDQSLLWDQDSKPPLPPSSPINTVEMDVESDCRPPLPLEPPPPSPQTEPPQTCSTEIQVKIEPKTEIKEEPRLLDDEPPYPSPHTPFTPPLPPKNNAS